MVWAGSPFAQLIEFSTGFPVGAVSYELFGNDGSSIHTGSVTPTAGDVSELVVIDAAHNACALPLFEMRTFTWTYTTATGLVADRVTYRVDKPLPFVVSPQDVRELLGVAEHELGDDAIDLVAAYAELSELIDGVDSVATTGNRQTILATKALAALAGLDVLPSIRMRAAQQETAGDDRFSRFRDIDWDEIELGLRIHLDRARAALDATFDGEGTGAFVFGTAPRSPDAITGET